MQCHEGYLYQVFQSSIGFNECKVLAITSTCLQNIICLLPRTCHRNLWLLLTYLVRRPCFQMQIWFEFGGYLQLSVCYLFDKVYASDTFAHSPLLSTIVTLQTQKVEQILN